jgi:hypothetical protein
MIFPRWGSWGVESGSTVVGRNGTPGLDLCRDLPPTIAWSRAPASFVPVVRGSVMTNRLVVCAFTVGLVTIAPAARAQTFTHRWDFVCEPHDLVRETQVRGSCDGNSLGCAGMIACRYSNPRPIDTRSPSDLGRPATEGSPGAGNGPVLLPGIPGGLFGGASAGSTGRKSLTPEEVEAELKRLSAGAKELAGTAKPSTGRRESSGAGSTGAELLDQLLPAAPEPQCPTDLEGRLQQYMSKEELKDRARRLNDTLQAVGNGLADLRKEIRELESATTIAEIQTRVSSTLTVIQTAVALGGGLPPVQSFFTGLVVATVQGVPGVSEPDDAWVTMLTAFTELSSFPWATLLGAATIVSNEVKLADAKLEVGKVTPLLNRQVDRLTLAWDKVHQQLTAANQQLARLEACR